MSREVKLIAHMPPQFRGFLLECLDPANPLHCAFDSRYRKLIQKLGGDEATIIEASEARDFTALELFIEGVTLNLLSGNPIDIGGWTQAMNSKSGKARVLRVAEKPKRVHTRRELMNATVTPINSAVAS